MEKYLGGLPDRHNYRVLAPNGPGNFHEIGANGRNRLWIEGQDAVEHGMTRRRVKLKQGVGHAVAADDPHL